MKILVVVDMQHDFVDGVLGTPEAVKIVGAVQRKVAGCLSDGGTVIYTRDTHTDNYLHTQEGRFLPVKHCVENTPGWEILPEVYAEGCRIVDKPTFGSFELADLLAGYEGVEQIELIGVCTDICVVSNALLLKARLPEVPLVIDAACCAGVTPESHQKTLDVLRMCQVSVINDDRAERL